MTKTLALLLSGFVWAAATNAAWAGPITFVNDYEGFLAAGGDVQTIDFETLPDGSPPIYASENPITPEFNYTEQGVTFSPFVGRLFVQGTPSAAYSLQASSYPVELQNWIIADLLTPAWAVGVFFPGSTRLSAYDAQDDLIATLLGSGTDHFLGILSDVPIASAVAGDGSDAEKIDSLHFTPVPEPATVVLLGVGGGMLTVSKLTSAGVKAVLRFTLSQVISSGETR